MRGRGRLRRRARVVLARLGPVCALLATVVVALMVVDAVYDDRRLHGIGWLVQPSAWWTVTALFALVGFALVGQRIRWGSRGVIGGFAVAGAATVLTLVLGGASYLGCSGPGVAFWTPFASTLKLFTGNTTNPFGGPGCAPRPPLALEVAQSFGLVSVFATVGGVLAAVLRDQLDRTVIRWAQEVVVVTGLRAESAEVLGAVAAALPEDVALVVVLDSRDPALVAQARAWGARIVVGDAAEPALLTPIVVRPGWRGGSCRLRTAYLLAQDAGRNDRVGEALQAIAADHPARTAVGRVVVRIDSPLQAEDWRRRVLEEELPLLSDTTGVHQVTARSLVDRAVSWDATRLVVLGESMLTLALLDEVAQLDRERAAADGPAPALRLVLGLGDSSELLADHVRHQARFGSTDGQVLTFAPTDAVRVVSDLVAAGETVVVVNAAAPTAGQQVASERLAAMLPRVPVLSWVEGARGLPSRSMMGNLWGFGLTLVVAGVGEDGEPVALLPEDGWTRAARRLHEHYVAQLAGGDGTATSWAELSDFYRESNVRQVWQAMTSATLAGRTFVRPADGRSPMPLTQAEVEVLAPLEHASWLAYYRDHGVRLGPRQDGPERPLRHPSLVSWESLSPEHRARTADGLMASLRQLAALGYVPFAAQETSGADVEATRWRHVSRSGSVTAVRRDEPWQWRTSGGEPMSAAAGDWDVTGEDGDRWSVTDADLRATYEHVAGDEWRRTGTVLARPGRVGEVVESQEGSARVAAGEWVLRDQAGHEWVVPATVFATAYTATSAGAP